MRKTPIPQLEGLEGRDLDVLWINIVSVKSDHIPSNFSCLQKILMPYLSMLVNFILLHLRASLNTGKLPIIIILDKANILSYKLQHVDMEGE